MADNIDLSGFKSSENTSSILKGCTSATVVDAHSLSPTRTNTEMLSGCTSLKEVNLGNSLPEQSDGMFSNTGNDKVIKATNSVMYDLKEKEAALGIDPNSYTPEEVPLVPGDTLKVNYDGLEALLAKITELGTYNLILDCTRAGIDQFKGDQNNPHPSPFGIKLSKVKPGIFFNLTFGFPDEVADASYCFYSSIAAETVDCIKTINITSAKGVTNVSGMFYDCSGLTSINTSSFTQVTNASYMFYNCSGLTSITGTEAFTQVTNASDMFYGCTGLTSINTKAFTQMTNASSMFDGCSGLTSINTSAFTQVTDASYMFLGCSGLTSITGTEAFTQVTDASGMFASCSGLTSIDTSAFTQVTDAINMFYDCSGLTSINTSAFTQVTTAVGMFYSCSGLKSIDTKAFTKVTNASSMFSWCSGLKSIDTSSFTQVTDAIEMFYNCSGLTTITWGSIKPTTNTDMFSGASAQKTITCDMGTKSWIEANSEAMKLTNYVINEPTTGTIKYNDLDNIIPGLSNNTIYTITVDCQDVLEDQFTGSADEASPLGLKLSKAPAKSSLDLKFINISPEINQSSNLFKGCTSIINIDLNDFIKFQNIPSMFEGCTGLTSIDIGMLDSAVDTSKMFYGCSNLRNVSWGDISPEPYNEMFTNSIVKEILCTTEKAYNLLNTNREAFGLSNTVSIEFFGRDDNTYEGVMKNIAALQAKVAALIASRAEELTILNGTITDTRGSFVPEADPNTRTETV